jgi:hypothetical protein
MSLLGVANDGLRSQFAGHPRSVLWAPVSPYGDLVVQQLYHPLQHASVFAPWDTVVLCHDVSERLMQCSPIPEHSVDKLVHIAPNLPGIGRPSPYAYIGGELRSLWSIKVKKVLIAVIAPLPVMGRPD